MNLDQMVHPEIGPEPSPVPVLSPEEVERRRGERERERIERKDEADRQDIIRMSAAWMTAPRWSAFTDGTPVHDPTATQLPPN